MRATVVRTAPPSTPTPPAGSADPAAGARCIYAFRKGPTERVVAELGAFGGRAVLNLRVTVALADGTMHYTRKGLTLGVHHLPELRAAVEALEAAARADGLLAVVGEEAATEASESAPSSVPVLRAHQ